MEKKPMHYLYLILFNINVQLHTIYLLFIHILGSIFFDQITERGDGRTEKHGSFYNIDLYSESYSCHPKRE